MDKQHQRITHMDQNTAFELVKSYVHFLTEQDLLIEKAYIFGSYAKGTFREESDIDVAVFLKHLENSFTMQVQLMQMRRNFDTRIEPHPFDAEDFKAGNPFVTEILRTGIPVFEKSSSQTREEICNHETPRKRMAFSRNTSCSVHRRKFPDAGSG